MKYICSNARPGCVGCPHNKPHNHLEVCNKGCKTTYNNLRDNSRCIQIYDAIDFIKEDEFKC